MSRKGKKHLAPPPPGLILLWRVVDLFTALIILVMAGLAVLNVTHRDPYYPEQFSEL